MRRLIAAAEIAVACCLSCASAAHAGDVFTGPAGTAVQITGPAGAHAGTRPKGVALVIHPGGWFIVGPSTLAVEQHLVDFVTRQGWLAINADYHAGTRSMADMRVIYDWARERYGTRLPYCALGESAGSQLALMLAVDRPSVRCVFGMGALTDLPHLKVDSPDLYHGTKKLFGGERALVRYSPITHVRRLRARVLLASSADDAIAPTSQISRFVARCPAARGMVLRGGDAEFVHAGVLAQDKATLMARARALLRSAADGA